MNTQFCEECDTPYSGSHKCPRVKTPGAYPRLTTRERIRRGLRDYVIAMDMLGTTGGLEVDS